MSIIGIVGKSGSGKTTAANIIKELFPAYTIVSFADKIKKVCSIVFDEDINLYYDENTKQNNAKGTNVSRRKIMQITGSFFRSFNDSIFCQIPEIESKI